jgi:epoxyqueuosine reductase
MTRWLKKKYHGRMLYLERNLDKRLDPRKVLPEAKSIISLALNYLHPVDMPYSDSTHGVISKYARGVDYHFVMENKLAQLLQQLVDLEPGAIGKIYSDTGPVMDKYWAVESGLGWLGKHTNVLSRENGSWFFLGEIILNLDLEPDLPGDDFCGSCTRCIDACPTNAIVEPYVLDSRKCISYSTIELKEDIPADMRRATGNLVFGCDICQDVCPWNRKAPYSQFREFDEPGRDYALRTMARITPDQFSTSLRRNPVKRTKWRGLMRNVAVAMGNSGEACMIPELTKLLHCEDAMVRRHAAWALGQIGGEDSRRAVDERLAVEDDEETSDVLRSTVMTMLGRQG